MTKYFDQNGTELTEKQYSAKVKYNIFLYGDSYSEEHETEEGVVFRLIDPKSLQKFFKK